MKVKDLETVNKTLKTIKTIENLISLVKTEGRPSTNIRIQSNGKVEINSSEIFYELTTEDAAKFLKAEIQTVLKDELDKHKLICKELGLDFEEE